MEEPLWALSVSELFKKLDSSKDGLARSEAEKRLKLYGLNEIAKGKKRKWFSILASQFRNPLIFMLILAAIVAYFLSDNVEALVIFSIVLLNSFLGFFQEYKAENTLEALKKYVTQKAKVLRDNEEIEINAKDLVAGDVVLLNIGDIVPADIRLTSVEELTADESILTGESVPVYKDVKEVGDSRTLLQYLTNVAFMGTSISGGYGSGIVISTGKNTFMGRMSVQLEEKGHEDEFQKNMRVFSNTLLKITAFMIVFVFAANALLSKGVFESFLFALALAVGIIPESLPVIITISLSEGAALLAKKKVVTKKLAAIEDLGNIDTLCCDKTGTLTNNNFSLVEYFDLDNKTDEKVLAYAMLCNSSNKSMLGNAIDKAIWASSFAEKVENKVKAYKIVDINEFDFKRKRLSVVAGIGSQRILIAKGAPESMLDVCSDARVKGEDRKMTKQRREEIKAHFEKFESDGYNVILVAVKGTKKSKTSGADEKDMTLVGFLLFLDPPKPTAKVSIKRFEELGVAIKVLTGDSLRVTRNICEKVGLALSGGKIVTGDELERLDAESFTHYAKTYNVFARVTPEIKNRIVQALNVDGHVVGFLGDGANDAAALKAADVGISVDSGTGVAKEAADIILLQKSLRVVADGIVEGRKTFSNITKYMMNTISANFGNMFTVALSSLFLNFIPLLPSQILLNNFLSDAPLLTIATDNVDAELVKKPRKWDLQLITKFMVWFGVLSSVFDIALILSLIFVFNAEVGLFRTAWFIESLISEILITFAIRTKKPFYKSKPSKLLLYSSIAAVIASFGVTYTVIGADLFKFVFLPIPVLLLILGILVAYFAAAELLKIVFYKQVEPGGA